MKTLVYWGVSWRTSKLTTLGGGEWIFSGPGRLLSGTQWRLAIISLIFQLNAHYIFENIYLIFWLIMLELFYEIVVFIIFGVMIIVLCFSALRLLLCPFLFIWVRGNMFQFHYDKLSCLAWRRFLPLSLNYLLFFVGIRCSVFSLL